MSERATLFLSSIGLLGEYCPTSRKKSRAAAVEFGCMHFGLLEENCTHFLGCRFMQPFPIARKLSGRGGFLVSGDNTILI
ncbi:hypothetical protein ACE6H2_005051 [Prunus campanulata]